MLVRTKSGILVNINLADYTTDREYYSYIMSLV